MSDQQIIELLQAGKYTKAGEKLYAYFPVVKKLVLANSGTVQDAQDIYQEALLILIRKVQTPTFTLTSGLNTYLYSISRLLWLEQLRRNNKKMNLATEPAAAPVDTAIDIHFEEEDKHLLAEKAFLMLAEKCRQLLQLFYYKQLPLAKIASLLKFSSQKVAKNQKYRCLEKAKENLKTLQTNSHE
jgi:RNA polymerase sigma factor (sigma-70 family)